MLKTFSAKLSNLKREGNADGGEEAFALTGGLKFQVTGNNAYELAEEKKAREAEQKKWKNRSALELLSQARPY